MEESPIKARFRLGGASELDPLLRLVQDEAERAPGLALGQLERLIGAGVASGKAEQERLAKRYGAGDPRAARAAEQTQAASVLFDLVGELKSGLDMTTETMTVRGVLKIEAEAEKLGVTPAGKTIEIVDKAYKQVHARTVTDRQGRFETTLEPPEKPEDELIPIALDDAGAIIARGESFAFKAGQTLTLKLSTSPDAGQGGDRLWQAEVRKREKAADEVRKKAADVKAAPAAKPAPEATTAAARKKAAEEDKP